MTDPEQPKQWPSENDPLLDELLEIRELAEEALGWDDAGEWHRALTKIQEIASR